MQFLFLLIYATKMLICDAKSIDGEQFMDLTLYIKYKM